MRKGKRFKRIYTLIVMLLLTTLILLQNVGFGDIFSLPDNFSASFSDVDNVNNNSLFGNFVHTSLEKGDTSVSSEKQKEGTIVFKLFGFIPIRKVKVNILPEEDVFIGGVPIGISLSTDGAIVISDTVISSDSDVVSRNKIFKSGDILKTIEGKSINSLDEVEDILNQSNGHVEIEYLRKNQLEKAQIDLIKNKEGKYKLGLWVKDDISGIGTLTYVKQENHDFVALGHPITDGKVGNIIPLTDGKVFDCSLIGINKGERNNPGELRCVFLQSNEKGEIKKNNKYGIFGHLDDLENMVDANLTATLGGRLGVKPGKAKIVSSVSGIREEYEIEIIKANYQAKSDDKSLVFRVTDKRLLELTGGIVQGMSGSPIIQNDKLIGAVTHVFLSDPTKGYGIYSDWLLEGEGK